MKEEDGAEFQEQPPSIDAQKLRLNFIIFFNLRQICEKNSFWSSGHHLLCSSVQGKFIFGTCIFFK